MPGGNLGVSVEIPVLGISISVCIPVLAPTADWIDHVVRPVLPQRLGIRRGRFDVDVLPAGLMEHQTDRVHRRVLRSDVDGGALLHMPESAPEHEILEVPGVGNLG